MKLLDLRQQVTITELSDLFQVSQMTIRRDLDLLESEGKIQRSHGGAVKVKRYMGAKYEQRASEHPLEKAAIAREAAKRIQDGMSIILDAGTTTAAMIHELERFRNLKVITRDLHIALMLSNEERFENMEVYCTGGRVSKWAYSMDGIYAERMINAVTVDIAFMTCEAVSPKGAMAWSPVLVGARQSSMKAANESILLADASKFSYTSFAIFSELNAFDEIITDDRLDEHEISMMRDSGYALNVVSVNEN
jgi:DeoR family transcriptional regulator of aga operon